MLTVVIGLSSALIFGAADFLGGLASKRISAIRVTAVASLVGLGVLTIAAPFFGGEWSWEAVFYGSLSGVSGAVAIVLLYASLAIGPMSILSPLTAVISAIVPLTWGLALGEQLRPIGYVALAVALVAIVLVGFIPKRNAVRPSVRGVVMASGSGVAIGLFLIIIDRAPDDSGLVPLLLNRGVNSVLMFGAIGILALVAYRRSARSGIPVASSGWRAGIPLAIACGIIDPIANALLLLGVRVGELSIMAVLIALYPAGTILLAAVVLKERIAVLQYVGLVLALVAAGMLALA